MVKLIGIIGKMGSGKTTIAEELVIRRYIFEELAFADAIVEGAVIFAKAKYIDPKNRSKEYRLIKQGIGEKMRELCYEVFGHRDVFIDVLFNRLRFDSVISDVRMLREAERILAQKGGRLIYLDVPSMIRKERLETRDNGTNVKYSKAEWVKLSEHSTERGVDAIFETFHQHKHFLRVDGRDSVDEIIRRIVDFAKLKQHPEHVRELIIDEPHPLVRKYGEEPLMTKEEMESWH